MPRRAGVNQSGTVYKKASQKPFLRELVRDIAHKPPHLMALGLARCYLDEQDFKDIGKLKDLRFLNIIDCISTDRCTLARAFEYLQSCHHLRTIVVSSERLDVAAAKKIVGMKVVRTIYYRNFSLSPEAREVLTKGGLTWIRTDDQACGFKPWSEPSIF